jgi:hypothetical protein
MSLKIILEFKSRQDGIEQLIKNYSAYMSADGVNLCPPHIDLTRLVEYVDPSLPDKTDKIYQDTCTNFGKGGCLFSFWNNKNMEYNQEQIYFRYA